MNRARFLSLCWLPGWTLRFGLLLVLALSVFVFTPRSNAEGELRVDESKVIVSLQREPLELRLPIENHTGSQITANFDLKLLDPQDSVIANLESVHTIESGKTSIKTTLPFYVSKLNESAKRNLLWTRLSYRITDSRTANLLAEGTLSFSKIASDLFVLKGVSSYFVREGGDYLARVQALHPLTNKAVPDVNVSARVKLEDGANSVILERFATTDSQGVATLDFVLPPRFPKFPHEVDRAGGELRLVGRRGALAMEVTADVLVDQFVKTILTTDKPLYQPAQVVHSRAILFSPSKKALPDQEVIFRVRDPEDLTVFQATVKTSRFGIAAVDWPIADNARLGKYQVGVQLAGGDSSEYLDVQRVRVSRYELPNFSVKVTPSQKYFLPGENAEVRVSADYLFGQKVAKGKVRIARESSREWNYRDQKWDIDEGDTYEGETNADGAFIAHINLSADHTELKDREYRRFDDLEYAAYFTDATTNRTEQRRFSLRITKEAIHVYLIKPNYSEEFNLHLPVELYVSTFYADGSPAKCKVDLTLSRDDLDEDPTITKQFRTNQYGLAKLPRLRFPGSWDEGRVEAKLTAHDSLNRTGTEEDDFRLDEDPAIVLSTDKSLYRPGDPILVTINAQLKEESLFVDIGQDARIIETKRLQLSGGRGQLILPYTQEFQGNVWISAYPSSPGTRRQSAMRAILYPTNRELAIEVKPTQATYRPGASARLDFRVRNGSSSSLESALGIVVVDSAVEERTRTDAEFGGSGGDSVGRFMGNEEQLAGVTLNQLRNLDMNKPVSPDLDLLAEILIIQNYYFSPNFLESDDFEIDQTRVFRGSTEQTISPLKQALKQHYNLTRKYPEDVATLKSILAAEGVVLDYLRDPWNREFIYEFSIDKDVDRLTVKCTGADRTPDTDDDFQVASLDWSYFLPVREAIERAVYEYHRRAGGFIRDFNTLNSEVEHSGISLTTLRDRWGQPYQFNFEIRKNEFVVAVRSGGPNRRLQPEEPYADDFLLSATGIDYFAELREKFDVGISQYLRTKKLFPVDEHQLATAVESVGINFTLLHDPWGTPYYSSFEERKFFGDSASIEVRSRYGRPGVEEVKVKPTTKRSSVIYVRSAGPDRRVGTLDDFSLASFISTVSEQSADDIEAKPVPIGVQVVFNGEVGIIRGVVVDSNGAVISGATVSIAQPQPRSTSTDDSGSFEFNSLASGAYELTITAVGFQKLVITEILVSVNEITDVSAVLNPSGTTETVTVVGDATVTLQTSASVSALPISGRRFQVVTKSGVNQDISTPRLREYFPETLLWQPELTTDKRGRAQLDFKLADNITTWKMSVIGSTESGEVGTAETEIRAFQPFFAELDPPRVLTQGDRISLPIVLRNYLPKAQMVQVTLEPQSWFSVVDSNRKSIQVPAADAKVQTFDLITKSSITDGKQRISAIGTDFSDAIEKPVTVHPDGEQKSETISDLFEQNATVNVNLPSETIPGSSRVELKVYPNLLTHVWESVEGIMRRPYGCAEQTISASYPSLLVLKHSKQEQADSAIEKKAKRYLEAGYQRLIGYQQQDGAFGYWAGSNPDIALTAYAIRFLTEAAEIISVDPQVIENATGWLIRNQSSEGAWKSPYYDKDDWRRTAMLTALVARTIAISEANSAKLSASKSDKRTLKSALDYLEQMSLRSSEPYLVANYALASIEAGDNSRAQAAALRLLDLSHSEGNGTYWSLETNTPFYGWGYAGRVEATALAVQALARIPADAPAEAEKSRNLQKRGLLFLLRSQDQHGVWYSTQATVNVLDALLSLLRSESEVSSDSKVDLVMKGQVIKTVDLPATQKMMAPITVDLTPFIIPGQNEIQLRRAGGPVASLQVVTNYYVPWTAGGEVQAQKRSGDAEAIRLEASFDKTNASVMEEITCRVKAERIGFRGYGMLLAEIGVPPGADVDRASLEAAKTKTNNSINSYEVLPDRVVLYLWPEAGGTEFTFKFKPRLAMTAKSELSVVYDYYNPEARAVVKPTLFTIR